MKRSIVLFLFVSLLFVLAACNSVPDKPADPAAHTKEAVETAAIQPDPAETTEYDSAESISEQAAQLEASEENIYKKTQQASICPCLAREHAEWNLARHGFSHYTGEVLNNVMTNFSAYLAAHYEALYQAYGDLLNRTLWLIDHDSGENLFYLQIIRFSESTAEQCVVLQMDGADISIHEEVKPLNGYIPAVCVNDSSDAAYNEALEGYKSHTNHISPVYFYRISAIENGTYIRTSFMASEEAPEAVNVYASYNQRSSSGQDVQLSSVDLDIVQITPELERILSMDFSEITYEVDGPIGDDAVLLQDFLLRFLTDDPSANSWDIPAATSLLYSEFYHIKNVFLTFMEELEKDAALKEQLWGMKAWNITLLGGAYYAVAGVIDDDHVLVMASAIGGLNGNEWALLRRESIWRLAREGSRSKLIPDEIQAAFADYVMTDYSYCYYLSGSNGRANWKWSIQGDGIYTVKCEWFSKANTSTTADHWILLQWENGTVQQTDHSRSLY